MREKNPAEQPNHIFSTWYVVIQYFRVKGQNMFICIIFLTNQTFFFPCFSFLFQLSVPLVGLRMLLNRGCTLKESTLAYTNMEPGVEIPDQSLGRRAGIGWWCWLPATATPTMFVDTPAWELSLLGKMSQVNPLVFITKKKKKRKRKGIFWHAITSVASGRVIKRLLVIPVVYISVSLSTILTPKVQQTKCQSANHFISFL